MPRGKKTPPEVVYNIMASWAVTGNYSETARELNMPESTVETIVKANQDKPEFVKLRDEKRTVFSKQAARIMEKGMELLERRFDRALEQEENLDILIDEIFETAKEELSQDEKNRLVAKLRALQLQDIRAITTAIGTLFDKKALADGNATDNVTVQVKLPEGIEEYAG